MLRSSNAVRGKSAESKVADMLERAGIATNPLTADDNGLDLSCQIPTLPLTSKQKQDMETGSQFEWLMSFETIN